MLRYVPYPEASLLRDLTFRYLTLPLYYSLAPHLQTWASGLDALAMFGLMLITVLLLASSGSSMPSSNPSLYKTTSSKMKTSKLGAWKVILIALVSCYLIPLGSADTGNKVCLETMMRDGLFVMALTLPFLPQVQDVDQHVDQFKLRGAVSTGAYADIGGFEEQEDPEEEEKEDFWESLLSEQERKCFFQNILLSSTMPLNFSLHSFTQGRKGMLMAWLFKLWMT